MNTRNNDVPAPEGGWTEDNLPDEFVFYCAYPSEYTAIVRAGDVLVTWGNTRVTYQKSDVALFLNDKDWEITSILKPNRKETTVTDNIKALHAVLKPFVRLKTREGTMWIYHGVRNDDRTVYKGQHHAYTPCDGFVSWQNNDLTYHDSSYDVVEVFDFPPHTFAMLNPVHIGPSLWKREERDSQLESLENALKEAQKALEAYRRENGV